MPMPRRLIAAVLTILPASLALAWMPEPPPGYGPPGYGYPGFPPSYGYPEMGRPATPWAPWGRTGPQAMGSEPQAGPAAAPEAQPSPSVPEATAQPQTGGGEPGATSPGQESPAAQAPSPGYGAPFRYPYGPRPYAGPGERQRVLPGQLRVTREVTDDAYLVHILVGDGKTEEVQVTPLGRSLAISHSTDAQTLQEDSFDEGRGYQRSFSYSRGAMSRRVGLPPDSDLAAMTREVKDGTITLRIPRIARRGWGPGYGPAQPPMPGAMPQGRGPAPMASPTPEAPPAPAGQP